MLFRHAARFCSSAILLGLIAHILACSHGPPTGEVRGKVTFKGQPVKEGRVTFLNEKGEGDAEAQIGNGGTYNVQNGVVLGDYKVEITPLVQIVDTDPGKSPPAPMEKPAPDIPMKYRQGNSPLRATVKSGKNEIDFDLTR